MKKQPRAKGMLQWFSGSIKRKLTLFVVLVCLLLIGLVWLLLTSLWEPMYRWSIRRDLESTAARIVTIVDSAEEDGKLYLEPLELNGHQGLFYSVAFVEDVQAAWDSGQISLRERSIDIADSTAACRFFYDDIQDSILHPEKSIGFWGTTQILDANVAVQLRLETFENGSIYYVLNSGQMVVGTLSASGNDAVLVAANIERTAQSVQLLRTLLLPVSGLLLLIAVVCAWIFSNWFTGPLRRLSTAAQEVAHGNYDVQVEESGNDEIATLATDFNIMAREVKRSSSLQRELLANVSHDLRTPLTLIKGYAETVRDLSGDDPVRREDQLNVIVDETDRLSGLVAKVLELSRVSSGNEKPDFVRFDLSQLCDEIGYRYSDFCTQNGCRFEFTTDGPCEVVADPALLERALHNLLGNAYSHIGEDGVIGLRVAHTGKKARVEIYDHGPGIDPKDLPYIFDRYYRSRADAGKVGTGLGLSITKAIFVTHGLDYGVESTLGKGSAFWFEVPLAQ